MNDIPLRYGCPRCDDQGYTLQERPNLMTLSPSDAVIVQVRCSHPGCRAATEIADDEIEA